MEIFRKLLAELLTSKIDISSVILFISAFTCVNLLIPIVIWVSLQKRLATPIVNRSSHRSITPPFGGVAFYMIFVVFICVIQYILKETTGYIIIAAISILFMIGLKDDLVHSTAKVKLIAQLIACTFVIGSEELQISTGSINNPWYKYIGPMLFSMALLILIINAYNLIDGIDGLAAITGMVSCTFYAYVFYQNKDYLFFLLVVITLGILSAFLQFNLSTKNRKIFMGDCGSLIIGLIIGIFSLRFLSVSPSQTGILFDHCLKHKVLILSAILFIPLLDTSRVIIIRLINRQSIFKADKNHIHHVLVDYGLSHSKAAVILGSAQSLVIIVMLSLSTYASTTTLGLIIMTLYSSAALLLYLISKIKNQYTNF